MEVIEREKISNDLFNLEFLEKNNEKYNSENINYSILDCPNFLQSKLTQKIVIATILDKICYLGFLSDCNEFGGITEKQIHSDIQSRFKNKVICSNNINNSLQDSLISYLSNPKGFLKKQSKTKKIDLLLIGTAFQIKVWKQLSKITFAKLVSYQYIANKINQPTAVRACATAIGKNPISYFIPCHRIVQSSGKFGKYHWGSDLKKKMIDFESL